MFCSPQLSDFQVWPFGLSWHSLYKKYCSGVGCRWTKCIYFGKESNINYEGTRTTVGLLCWNIRSSLESFPNHTARLESLLIEEKEGNIKNPYMALLSIHTLSAKAYVLASSLLPPGSEARLGFRIPWVQGWFLASWAPSWSCCWPYVSEGPEKPGGLQLCMWKWQSTPDFSLFGLWFLRVLLWAAVVIYRKGWSFVFFVSSTLIVRTCKPGLWEEQPFKQACFCCSCLSILFSDKLLRVSLREKHYLAHVFSMWFS